MLLLLILLFVFCSKLRKKSGLFYKGDPRKCRGGGMATLARHPVSRGNHISPASGLPRHAALGGEHTLRQRWASI